MLAACRLHLQFARHQLHRGGQAALPLPPAAVAGACARTGACSSVLHSWSSMRGMDCSAQHPGFWQLLLLLLRMFFAGQAAGTGALGAKNAASGTPI